MTAVLRKPTTATDIAEAARQLGKLGGRPKGRFSSPLAKWLRQEVSVKLREGWSQREAFDIAADTHHRDGRDAFTLDEQLADELGIDTVDATGGERPARVTWAYWKKIWLETKNQNRFP